MFTNTQKMFMAWSFLHLIFLVLTYNSKPLSYFPPTYAIIMHRFLLLAQFVPILIVLCSPRLSKNKLLSFLAFAITLDALYAVNDFGSGFYGAVIDYNSELMPRMRSSAHLMAYSNLGRISILDYHAEYFLEYVIVYFLSEITSMNFILVYVFIIRVVIIVSWTLVFTIISSNFSKNYSSRLRLLLIAASFLVANGGYNYEVSFAPLILVIFFLLINRKKEQQQVICVILTTLAILFASFRETLVLAIVCIIAASVDLGYVVHSWSRSHKHELQLQLFIFTIAVLATARVVTFSTLYYLESYTHAFFNLIKSVWKVLIEGSTVKKEPLGTILTTGNPIDRVIDMASAVSMILLLTALALVSMVFTIRRRVTKPLLIATLVAYILLYTLPVIQYGLSIIFGYGVDFASATALARSLAPLVALTIAYYSPSGDRNAISIKNNKRIPHAMFLVSLLLITMFAPFTFIARGEIKSNYDAMRTTDASEAVVLANKLYYFVTSYRKANTVIKLHPSAKFLLLYYMLPLDYVTGGLCDMGSPPPLTDIVYANGMFSATVGINFIFLNEA